MLRALIASPRTLTIPIRALRRRQGNSPRPAVPSLPAVPRPVEPALVLPVPPALVLPAALAPVPAELVLPATLLAPPVTLLVPPLELSSEESLLHAVSAVAETNVAPNANVAARPSRLRGNCGSGVAARSSGRAQNGHSVSETRT